ncbi:MAG: toprim domain-containing protein [Patescibacteria group bacterium]
MNEIDKLTEYFTKFPGIGQRQAKRFVYFLLTRNSSFLKEFTDLILSLKKSTKICSSCFRFYSANSNNSHLCNLCLDKNRDSSILMVVAKDADLNNIERIGDYNGSYFVLGGLLPILEKNPEERIRIKPLINLIKEKAEAGVLKEVILALSLNPEGENTTDYILRSLKPLAEEYKIKIATLGRGLSTGTELEYLDDDTFENAFKNRS